MTESNNSVAVIGMGCVYPGAHTPLELWQNVLAGRRFFRKSPPERLPRPDYFDPDPSAAGKSYCDQMALISDWSFNPVAYRILPVTVDASDITHWLALATVQAALDDASLDLAVLERSRIGVILGNTLTGEFFRSHVLKGRWPYVERALQHTLQYHSFDDRQIEAIAEVMRHYFGSPLSEINEDSLAGNMSNTIAGRICNYFDLGGGGYTVDGACSSSLLSVAHGCNALLNNEMDYAICGGVDVSLDPFEIVGFAKTNALAKDDIRPYDADATGMLPGEGCGIVVLTHEETARWKGYPIHALIKGWGVSSDGRGNSITAPKVEGQMSALEKAYQRADYPISSVRLFEGHGTGTALGDKVEIEAIRRLIEKAPDLGISWIGSIKSNIGHCKAAAGMAGMIKAIMALKRKILPPTMNCEHPNPVFGQPISRLRPTVRGTVWAKDEFPRRASVSAMGFGGANSHVTLEEANPDDNWFTEDLEIIGSQKKTELILLTGDSLEHLQSHVDKLFTIADLICRAELTDLSAALTKLPHTGRYRLAIVTDSPWDLAQKLQNISRQLISGSTIGDIDAPAEGIFAALARENPELVALFPGQAAQHLNMGEHIVRLHPFVENFYKDVDHSLSGILPEGLLSYILHNPHSHEEEITRQQEKLLADTRLAQPAIVLTSLATLKVLDFYGLKPAISIGHSLGEICALQSAGAFDPVAAVQIATLRGHAMSELQVDDPGIMAAIAADPQTVAEIIAPFVEKVIISNYNSPTQTIISGDTRSVGEVVELCKKQKIRSTRLPVSMAFHSSIVAPASQLFRQSLESFSANPLTGKVISTATAREIQTDEDIIELLAEHIKKPVLFSDAVNKAAAEEPDLWIEIGPRGILSKFVPEILGDPQLVCLPTDLASEDGSRLLNEVIARTFVLGFPVVPERLFENRFHRLFPLQDYKPVFITNPCENPVSEPDFEKIAPSSNLPVSLLPDKTSKEEFSHYLSQRGDFLRTLVAADYEFFKTAGEISSAPGQPVTAPKPPIRKTPKETEPESADIFDFATRWIARRTGYPQDSITPEMRLRDDLNFDSIKVGELVINLARKLQVSAPSNTREFANSTLEELLNILAKNEEAGADGLNVISRPAGESGSAFSGWARTFQVEYRLAPLEDDILQNIPRPDTALIIGASGNERTEVIAGKLNEIGFATLRADFDSLDFITEPDAITLMVMLLEPADTLFSQCRPDAFEARTMKWMESLFTIHKWLAENRRTGLDNIKGIILRPAQTDNDITRDISSGAAFLKSLRLEYPEADLKWVEIPQKWPAARWSETLVAEMTRSARRSWFAYTQDGLRFTDGVGPRTDKAGDRVGYTNSDVMLVTGGAKGITFELASALAAKHGMKLGLMGTSSAVEESETTGEMSENFRRLKKLGIEYLYHQCDVKNPAAVKSAIHAIRKQLGPVTVILHGAGMTRPQSFIQMDREDFRNCVRIKVSGLYNLLQAVDISILKSVQALSSVLGRTGMAGQVDYTLANAWLDGALDSFARSCPSIHCFTLGYSVWAEAGLGKKAGSVETLAATGVVPIGTSQGVEAYLALAENWTAAVNFITTGRLTPELDAVLYHLPEKVNGRFLEKISDYYPQTEITSEAAVSHNTDLYLPDHVFEGTAMMPGVIAIEAMTQAAALCAGSSELPVLRDISFNRPLIVSEDRKVALRIHALVKENEDPGVAVSVDLRSENDDFASEHFTMTALFDHGTADSAKGIDPASIPGPLDLDLEEFKPLPLFQGKLFQHIVSIRQRDVGIRGITEIRTPHQAAYFGNDFDIATATPAPAMRDAFLQSAGLVLSQMCLPVSIGEIIFHRQPAPDSPLFCVTEILKEENGVHTTRISIYDATGEPVETLENVAFAAIGDTDEQEVPDETGLSLSSFGETLDHLPEHFPHIMSSVRNIEVQNNSYTEISPEDKQRMAGQVGPARLDTALANLIAVRRAAVRYARVYLGLQVEAALITLAHHPDGKPKLKISDPSLADAFAGIDISLTDHADLSIALIGPSPLGVDLEVIEKREPDTWRKLLGRQGYDLARQVAELCCEPFDMAATRIWTILEAGIKTGSVKDAVPVYTRLAQPGWQIFNFPTEDSVMEFHSILTTVNENSKYILSLVVNTAIHADTLQAVFDAFVKQLALLHKLCASDPDHEDTEVHYQRFSDLFEQILDDLEKLTSEQPDDKTRNHKLRISRETLAFVTDRIESESFRRALEKPLGYPGDYLLMDMMLANSVTVRGLGYHFDRKFLAYHGSEGVRQRTYWVVDHLKSILAAKKDKHLTVLDIGCGPMTIEKILAETFADTEVSFTFLGLDIDTEAMAYARSRLRKFANVELDIRQCNLLSQEGIDNISLQAPKADVCICMGFFDYLDVTTISAFLETLYTSIPSSVPVYFANYHPDHPAQAAMEWLLDWWLIYNTEEEMRQASIEAGFAPEKVHTEMDASGSIVLVEVEK